MNKIPNCKTKVKIISQQPQYLKVNKITKQNNSNNLKKASQKSLKINSTSRQFGNDITSTIKNIDNNKEYQKIPVHTINTNIITSKVIQKYFLIYYFFCRDKYI